MVNVARKTSTGEYIPETFKEYALEDNNSCPDGSFAYAVQGNILSESEISRALRGVTRENDENQDGISCGTTVNAGGSGGGNLPSLLMGFLLALFFVHSRPARYF